MSGCEWRQKESNQGEGVIAIAKARVARELRALTGEERSSSRSPSARDDHRFESPQLHQEVRANRHDFLRRRIARHFRSLPRQGPVSVRGPGILRGNSEQNATPIADTLGISVSCRKKRPQPVQEFFRSRLGTALLEGNLPFRVEERDNAGVVEAALAVGAIGDAKSGGRLPVIGVCHAARASRSPRASGFPAGPEPHHRRANSSLDSAPWGACSDARHWPCRAWISRSRKSAAFLRAAACPVTSQNTTSGLFMHQRRSDEMQIEGRDATQTMFMHQHNAKGLLPPETMCRV